MDWFQLAKDGGAILAPFLIAALAWLNTDRNRLLEIITEKDTLLQSKDDKLASLSERTLVMMAEIKTFLFNSGRPA